MTANFHPGMRVVCVRDAGKSGEAVARGYKFPIRGGIYTIREIVLYKFCSVPLALLVEIVNPATFPWYGEFVEVGCNLDRLRPVIDGETDIEIFTKLLHTQRVRTDA